jgi:hypothetical protein
MTEETPRDRKADLINQILDIELGWFLTVNPTITAKCQENPEAFKLMRRDGFEIWSEETLALYLEHLIQAKNEERNLVREKYAKMQELIPCEIESSAITENVAIQERWQKETRDNYPGIFREGTGAGFARYLRCELDTYSQAVLNSYLKDIKAALLEGRNPVIETYDRIARKLGHSSLEEWHRKREMERQQD